MIRVYRYRNLLFLRKKKGWTQVEMQNHCGISGATWSNYENGKTEPDIQTLAIISKVFKVSIDDLILKNFEDVHLIEKNEDEKKQGNVHLSVHPTVHPIGEKEVESAGAGPPETGQKEINEVSAWAIMGQLKEVQEKLDQLKLLAEKGGQNQP